jgi:hypothetical protein
VSASASPQFTPAVTLDAQGNALAIWITNGPSGSLGNELWSSRYVPGSGWSAPVQVDTGNGSASMTGLTPQLVGNSSGQALAVWVQWVATGDDAGNYALWGRVYSPASGWGAATQIAPSLDGLALSFSAGMDAQGNALVAWPQSTSSGGSQIAVTRYVAGQWAGATAVQPGSGVVTGSPVYNLYPQITVTASGAAALAWQQTDLTNSALWAASYSPTGGWSNITQVVADTPGTHDSGVPAIGLDGSGDITLAWGELDTNSTGAASASIQTRRYVAAGAGWQSVQTVGTPVSETDVLVPAPVLAVNEAGVAALAWSPPPGESLLTSVADASGNWGTTVLMSAQLELNNGLPQLAIDGSGRVTLAWVNSTSEAAWVSQYTNGAWNTPRQQGDSAQGANWLALATNSSGSLALLWQTTGAGSTAGSAVQGIFYTPGQ